MRAGFLFKKIILWIIILFFFMACVIGAFCRLYVKKVDLKTSFHFLVSEEKSVEAGAEFIKLEGGAGYILRYENKDYAVLSVYLSQEDASSVQEVLSLQNRQTQLISVSAPILCFFGKKQCKKENVYVGALRTLYACLTVLEETVSKLEKGMTQEKSKGILAGLKKQLSYMSEVYADGYPAFSVLCEDLAGKLPTDKESVIYASRLRYLQCEAVDGYLNVTKEFS